MSFPGLVSIWIWVSALATAAGWLLSAVGQLNGAGYLVFTALVLIGWWVARRSAGSPVRAASGRRFARTGLSALRINRFRRPLPLAFAVLAVLIFLGGALYPPSNHTALTYRTERVLHWLAEGHWHWIYTPNHRLNTRACGIEWLSAPLLLFTHSDRGIFLLNFIPYLLMPSLLFSLWTRLGVRPRVAWPWMWLLPTGYSFLLQAGSAGNDAFPTVYALAAMDFGCRAWKSGRLSDLWVSALGAALLVGAKASNLPLLLPWAVIVVPLFPLIWGGRPWLLTSERGRPYPREPSPEVPADKAVRAPALKAFSTFGIALLALLVSFLPTAILNLVYCYSWSGMQLERAGMAMKNPIVGIWGNSLLFALHNFVPPIFPIAGWWNQSALNVLPQALVRPLVANFEQSFHFVGELPTEDWSGLGFGVSILLVISVLAALFNVGRRSATLSASASPIPGPILTAARLTPWLSLLTFCIKSGMVTGARLISPYYPFLFAALLFLPGNSVVVRRTWWRLLAWCVIIQAFAVLVVTPGRPLWPAETILSKLSRAHPENRLLSRALNVYTVYAGRSDPLACIRPLLPSGVKRVGFLGNPDDIDISLWRPFGTRQVLHVMLNDSARQIRDRSLGYIVVAGFNLHENGTNIQEWMNRVGADLVATTNATLRVAEGSQEWHVTRLR